MQQEGLAQMGGGVTNVVHLYHSIHSFSQSNVLLVLKQMNTTLSLHQLLIVDDIKVAQVR